ncbi:hypothetical protein [Bdellovibrio bacteriovorus]|uniref:hypothetical protein n=1 Tax=Bdellovibrio bacteriovorus TaxID=959 RepID=UPI0035A5D8A8
MHTFKYWIAGILASLSFSMASAATSALCGGLQLPKEAYKACLKSQLPLDGLYACAKSFNRNDVIALCVSSSRPTDVIYTCGQINHIETQKKCLVGNKTSEQIVKCMISNNNIRRLDSCVENSAAKSASPDGQH